MRIIRNLHRCFLGISSFSHHPSRITPNGISKTTSQSLFFVCLYCYVLPSQRVRTKPSHGDIYNIAFLSPLYVDGTMPYEPGYPSFSYTPKQPPPIYEQSYEFFLKHGRLCNIPEGFTHDAWREYETKHPLPIVYEKWKSAHQTIQTLTEAAEKSKRDMQNACIQIKTLNEENKRLQNLLTEACEVIRQYSMDTKRTVSVNGNGKEMKQTRVIKADTPGSHHHHRGTSSLPVSGSNRSHPVAPPVSVVDWKSKAIAHMEKRKNKTTPMTDKPPPLQHQQWKKQQPVCVDEEEVAAVVIVHHCGC